MLEPADLLILDEPTNDLDIPSMEVLEESLEDFPGALVLVTHDRYMLDNISTELLVLDGRGGHSFVADYSQWERAREVRQAAPVAPRPSAVKAPPTSNRGLTAQERRELSRMEAAITAAEEAVSGLKRQLEDPSVASDAGRLNQAWNDLATARARVDALYVRWQDLEARGRTSP
jgi:ATP-binding cassette subfamily F protein uup